MLPAPGGQPHRTGVGRDVEAFHGPAHPNRENQRVGAGGSAPEHRDIRAGNPRHRAHIRQALPHFQGVAERRRLVAGIALDGSNEHLHGIPHLRHDEQPRALTRSPHLANPRPLEERRGQLAHPAVIGRGEHHALIIGFGSPHPTPVVIGGLHQAFSTHHRERLETIASHPHQGIALGGEQGVGGHRIGIVPGHARHLDIVEHPAAEDRAGLAFFHLVGPVILQHREVISPVRIRGQVSDGDGIERLTGHRNIHRMHRHHALAGEGTLDLLHGTRLGFPAQGGDFRGDIQGQHPAFQFRTGGHTQTGRNFRVHRIGKPGRGPG